MSESAGVEVGPEDGQLRLATALASAESVEGVAQAVIRWAASAGRADFANLAVFVSSANSLRVIHADSLDTAIAGRWSEFSIDTPTPPCHAVLTGEPVLLTSREDYTGRYDLLLPDTVAAGLQATASLALKADDGAAIGAVGFAWAEPQTFAPRQLSRLRLIAELAAQALQRVNTAPKTAVTLGGEAARALQEVFLPNVPGHMANLEQAAAYLPASEAAMGGDWFDVFPVETGTCLVVGDIGGHGLQAAALMAELRSAIRALAVDDPSPARIVTRANRVLCQLHPKATATLIVGVWHPETHTWLRCNAGHPAVLRCRQGEVAYLPAQTKDIMLGADPTWQYHEEPKTLRAGTTLLMYTDGLIEIRQQGVDAGMEALLRHVEALVDLSPQAVVDDVLLWRLSRGPATDDLCLLAVRLG